MEKVVYFLGAGFSAPLGLPVMSDFLIKSKDMYESDPERYKHFQVIFGTINAMSAIKNYYDADLFNIEEILSILEMKAYLDGSNLVEDFRYYIADVISHFTPEIPNYGGSLPSNWWTFTFGRDAKWTRYGYLFGNLMNLTAKIHPTERKIVFSPVEHPATAYSIVTLNYDMIFEKLLDYVTTNHMTEGHTLQLLKSLEVFGDYVRGELCLAKLHGSIFPLTIVPPTWNKGSNGRLASAWQLARRLLKEASHIRILGYSLQTSDAYIRYLLKSSALDSSHLKTIDVICRDTNGEVKKRYDHFINFKYYRFKDKNIEDYLEMLRNGVLESFTITKGLLSFDRLETLHEEFMSQ